MALFPLSSNFEGDFMLQLLPVDTENTMDEVAAAAAYHTVGRRVKIVQGRFFVCASKAARSFYRGP